MKLLFWSLLLFANTVVAQSNEKFLLDFLQEGEINQENVLAKFIQFDFSEIWTQTHNSNVLGIIGSDHQRIKIKLLSIEKVESNPYEYVVNGKSCVKGTICDFTGRIAITKVQEVNEMHLGIDDEYSEKGIKSQGMLTATYVFAEDENQEHSGVFRGQLFTKWYLTSDNRIQYDNIESVTDRYSNNAFIGTWESYSSNKVKLCNWADFRVPMANRDFDIGAGEFSPSEKYFKKGWLDYKMENFKEWWK